MKRLWQKGTLEEVAEAVEFFESRSPGLGARFRRALEYTLRFIDDFPEAAQKVQGAARRAVVHEFPYSVIYEVEGDELLIYAVMHGRRDPEAWKSRP